MSSNDDNAVGMFEALLVGGSISYVTSYLMYFGIWLVLWIIGFDSSNFLPIPVAASAFFLCRLHKHYFDSELFRLAVYFGIVLALLQQTYIAVDAI